MKKFRTLSILAVAGLTTGCNDFQPHVVHVPAKGDYTVAASASLRPGMVFDNGGRHVACLPPPPDAGFREADEFDLSISIASVSTGDEAADAVSESGEQEFVGRTPALLLTRELMFQNCLAAQNMGLSKDEQLALHNKTLDTIATIFASETDKTSVTISQTLSDTDSDTDSDSSAAASGSN